MTVYAITDTKKRRTGIAPTYLHTTLDLHSKGVNKCQLADMFCISWRTLYRKGPIIHRFKATAA